MTFLSPKKIEVKGIDDVERSFIISKVPATVGRELVAKYPTSMVPKIGDYKVSEETMLLLMSYVARVDDKGNETVLKTKELVDNHVPDWEMLAKLEMHMIQYNTSFFGNGKGSGLLDGLKDKVQEWITKTLTASLQQSSPKDEPRSTN